MNNYLKLNPPIKSSWWFVDDRGGNESWGDSLATILKPGGKIHVAFMYYILWRFIFLACLLTYYSFLDVFVPFCLPTNPLNVELQLNTETL
jgi:hypothetical protein